MMQPGELLSWRARIICGVVGMGAVALGAIAVFVTTNSAGTLALISIGGILALVGVNGLRIRNMRVGGAELAFASLAQRACVANGSGDNEEAQHLWQEILHLARARFGGPADPDDFRKLTKAVIKSLSDSWTVWSTPSGRSPVPIIDAVLETGTSRIGLAVRAGTAFNPTSVAASLADETASALKVDGFLVVVNCTESAEKLAQFESVAGMFGIRARAVGWQVGESPDILQRSLEELLRQVSRRAQGVGP